MSVQLSKGSRVDLTKTNPGLSNLLVGLGWSPNKDRSAHDFDLDAFAPLLNEQGKLQNNDDDIVYFGNLVHKSKSVTHTGDNLTGDGDGDDEQILVDLQKIPETVHRIVFAVNIYQAYRKRQDFSMVDNAFIRIVNAKSGQELVRFNLSDNYKGMTAVTAGEIYRNKGEWKFFADGKGSKVESITEYCKRFK
jgi:stress response protein SCP2